MDPIQAILSDAGLLLFSAAGLVATTVAILYDTRAQVTEVAKAPVKRSVYR